MTRYIICVKEWSDAAQRWHGRGWVWRPIAVYRLPLPRAEDEMHQFLLRVLGECGYPTEDRTWDVLVNRSHAKGEKRGWKRVGVFIVGPDRLIVDRGHTGKPIPHIRWPLQPWYAQRGMGDDVGRRLHLQALKILRRYAPSMGVSVKVG